MIIKKSRSLLLLSGMFSMVILNGCVFEELDKLLENSKKITNTLQQHCDCEEISVMNYSVNNLSTTATYKLVGCDFNNIDSEALRIRKVLSDSIPGFCDIAEFNLVFINKGKERIKSFTKCQEK